MIWPKFLLYLYYCKNIIRPDHIKVYNKLFVYKRNEITFPSYYYLLFIYIILFNRMGTVFHFFIL